MLVLESDPARLPAQALDTRFLNATQRKKEAKMDQLRRRHDDFEPADHEQWGEIAEGASVYGRDGQKFGEVSAPYRHYLIVERGVFFPKDYFIPRDAIEYDEADRVYLRLPTDLALRQGWDVPPAEAMEAKRRPRASGNAPVSSSNAPTGAQDPATANFTVYPDTYAVGTNTDSYEAIVPPDESDNPSGPSR
jgi:hypothetical protein